MIESVFANSGELDRGVFDPFYGEYFESDVRNKIVENVLQDNANSSAELEFSVYDEEKNLRIWKRGVSFEVKNGNYEVDVLSDIENSQIPDGSGFIARYNFFENKLDDLFVQSVSNDRREARVRPEDNVSAFNNFFLSFDFNSFELVANFGENQYFRILNTTPVFVTDDDGNVDDENPFEGSVVLRFASELPNSIQRADNFEVDEEVSRPYFDRFDIFRGIEPTPTNTLADPDFSIEVSDSGSKSSSQFESLDDISDGQNFTTTEDFIKSKLDASKSVDLNIDFTEFENFIHFSSAAERLRNFRFKIKKIYKAVQELENLTSPSTAGRKETLRRRIEEIVGSFDAFEEWLFRSDSEYAYPKNDNGALEDPGGVEATQWFQLRIEDAEDYDSQNQSALRKQIPEYVKEDPENDEFVLFVDLIGQWFDVNWIYIDQLENLSNQTENALESGSLSSNLSRTVLESFGFESFNGFDAEEFFDSIFDSDKISDLFSTADIEESSLPEVDGFKIDYTRFEAQQQIWRRLLTNLIYYYKTKGTGSSIDALKSIFGVPADSLVIREDGGAGAGSGSNSKFKLEETSHYLPFSSQKIEVPFETNPTFEQPSNGFDSLFDDFEDYPKVVEVRFRTEYQGGVPLKLFEIFENVEVRLERTQLGTNEGKIVLEVEEADGTRITAETGTFELFDGEWINILFQFRKGKPYVDLFAQKRTPFGEVGQSVQTSLKIGLQTAFEILNSSKLIVGGEVTSRFSEGVTFVGDLDSIAMWQESISGEQFDEHTITPTKKDVDNEELAVKDSIYDTELEYLRRHLLFRTDFRVPKDLSVDNTIENQSEQESTFDVSQVTGTAFGFSSVNQSPWQFERYKRENFYLSQQIGVTSYFNTKVTIEDNELNAPLQEEVSSEIRNEPPVTKDSRQLAIFFSPYTSSNRDVFSEIGIDNVNSVLGNPKDQRREKYYTLDGLNKLYWNKYEDSVNVQKYIRYVDQFYSAFFEHIENSVPARSSLTDGILIEPSVLERDREKIPEGVVEVEDKDARTEKLVNVDSSNLNAGLPQRITETFEFETQSDAVRNENFPEIFVSDEEPNPILGEEGDVWIVEGNTSVNPEDDEDGEGRDAGFIISGTDTPDQSEGGNRDLWIRLYDGPVQKDRVNFDDLLIDSLRLPSPSEGDDHNIFAFFSP